MAAYISLDVIKNLWGGVFFLELLSQLDDRFFVHLHPGRGLLENKVWSDQMDHHIFLSIPQ